MSCGDSFCFRASVSPTEFAPAVDGWSHQNGAALGDLPADNLDDLHRDDLLVGRMKKIVRPVAKEPRVLEQPAGHSLRYRHEVLSLPFMRLFLSEQPVHSLLASI
jgi:hypothetical protein